MLMAALSEGGEGCATSPFNSGYYQKHSVLFASHVCCKCCGLSNSASFCCDIELGVNALQFTLAVDPGWALQCKVLLPCRLSVHHVAGVLQPTSRSWRSL